MKCKILNMENREKNNVQVRCQIRSVNITNDILIILKNRN